MTMLGRALDGDKVAIGENLRQMIGVLRGKDVTKPQHADFVTPATLDAVAALVLQWTDEAGVARETAPAAQVGAGKVTVRVRREPADAVRTLLEVVGPKSYLWFSPPGRALREWARERLGAK